MGKFIGEKEIKDIQGNEVTFMDDTIEYYTDKQLSYLVTDEAKDATAMRWLLLDNIVPEIYDIFTAHNIKKWDFNAVMNSIVWTYNMAFNKSVSKAFGTYDEKLPSESCVEQTLWENQ